MAEFLKRFRRKVSSNRGESITEVLAAIVVSGLAILLMAVAISAAASLNKQSYDRITAYYTASNGIVAGEASTDGPVSNTPGTVTLTLKDPTLGSQLANANVTYTISTQFGDTPIISYKGPQPAESPQEP